MALDRMRPALSKGICASGRLDQLFKRERVGLFIDKWVSSREDKVLASVGPDDLEAGNIVEATTSLSLMVR